MLKTKGAAKRLRDDSGSVLILAALSMTILLGFVAFATDVGVLLYQRRQAQTAADCAAMAGVAEENFLAADGTTVQAAAWAAAKQNGFDHSAAGITVTVNDPPLSGAHVGQSGYVEVIVQQSVQTTFMGLFGHNSMTVSARAVGGFGGSQNCITTLDTSGADISDSGPGGVVGPGCNIYDDSSSSNAISLSNSSINVQKIDVVGGAQVGGGGASISPTPTTGVAPTPDPLAFLPAPANPGGCTSVSVGGGATLSLVPGCYSSITVNNGTLNLNPSNSSSALYYLTGNLQVNSSSAVVNGTNVTFFLSGNASASVTNGTLNLSAPGPGTTYNGILFFQSRTDNQQFNFTGPSTDNIKGIFYLPDADVKFTDGSGNFFAAIVAQQMILTGPAEIQSFALVNPANPLATPTLVE